jgi:23S rRNA (guanosine2251-2'-O)-methyltransferase
VKQNKVYTYGRHALEEALTHAPHAVLKVFAEQKALGKELREKIERAGVAVAPLAQGVSRADLKSGASHQGIVGQISLFNLLVPYQKFAEHLKVSPATSLVVLAGIQDPHNVGAIIRSAAGFGTSGVLLPQKAQAPVTGAVLKVSAGMAFRVPLVSVSDLQQTISDLKKRGFVVYGLAGEGAARITKEQFSEPAVFVLGNEGEGLPAHVKKLCDKELNIPMHPRCESLNVAAAAATTLFAWSSTHTEALR